jgi:hypothetical protein
MLVKFKNFNILIDKNIDGRVEFVFIISITLPEDGSSVPKLVRVSYLSLIVYYFILLILSVG